jgi:hypothetical protein
MVQKGHGSDMMVVKREVLAINGMKSSFNVKRRVLLSFYHGLMAGTPRSRKQTSVKLYRQE